MYLNLVVSGTLKISHPSVVVLEIDFFGYGAFGSHVDCCHSYFGRHLIGESENNIREIKYFVLKYIREVQLGNMQ